MNHEVEHHVDVERPRREDAQAVYFEKHWLGEDGNGRANGGVEALEMSDLGNGFMLAGKRDQFVGLFQRGCDGFLDEDIDAGLDHLSSDGKMMQCGSGYGYSLHFAVSGQ